MELIIPEQVIPEDIDPTDLPPKWRKYPPPQHLATLGSSWLHSNRSLLLRVPSAVVENEFNVLINPKHKDLKLIQAIGPIRFEFDGRLLKL